MLKSTMQTSLPSLNIRVLGSGSQVVTLAHGFGCNQSIWDALIPSLLSFNGGSLKLILWDWPGSSSSSSKIIEADDGSIHPNLYHTLSILLLKILDQLHISSCIFIGHSMSAMVGCLAALAQPYRFSKLILVAASPRYMNEGGYEGGFERKDLEKMYGAMEADFQGWSLGFAKVVLGASASMEMMDKFRSTLAGMRCHVAISMARIIFESDFRGILQAFLSSHSHPSVHFLQTQHDFAVPSTVNCYLHHLLTHHASPPTITTSSSLEVLPINGHFPHLTQPSLFYKALLPLL